MRSGRFILLAGVVACLPLALAACGQRSALIRPKGSDLPVKPLHAQQPANADQLLRPSTEAYPARNDELLLRSDIRKEDPFDLPPKGKATP